MAYEVIESDWKLFRQKMSVWYELFMERLVSEYSELLNRPDTASDRFYALSARIEKDRRHTLMTARMSRSNMFSILIALVSDGIVKRRDLEGFSKDLRGRLELIVDNTDKELSK